MRSFAHRGVMREDTRWWWSEELTSVDTKEKLKKFTRRKNTQNTARMKMDYLIDWRESCLWHESFLGKFSVFVFIMRPIESFSEEWECREGCGENSQNNFQYISCGLSWLWEKKLFDDPKSSFMVWTFDIFPAIIIFHLPSGIHLGDWAAAPRSVLKIDAACFPASVADLAFFSVAMLDGREACGKFLSVRREWP